MVIRDYSRQNNQQSRVGLSVDERLFKFVYNNPQMADELDPDEEERYYEWADKKEQEDAKVAHKYNGEITSETDEIIDEAPAETPPIKVDGRVDPSSLKLLGTHTDGEPKPYGWALAEDQLKSTEDTVKPDIIENLQGETPKLGIHTEGEPEPVGWDLAEKMARIKAPKTEEETTEKVVPPRSSRADFMKMLKNPSKLTEEDTFYFRTKDGGNLKFSGKRIKEMMEANEGGWGDELAGIVGYESLGEMIKGYPKSEEAQPEAPDAEGTLTENQKLVVLDELGSHEQRTAAAVKLGYKNWDSMNPKIKYSKKVGGKWVQNYEPVFKSAEREYLVRSGKIPEKDWLPTERDTISREKLTADMGEFFEYIGKGKQWTDDWKPDNREGGKKGIFTSTKRKDGKRPHREVGGVDIAVGFLDKKGETTNQDLLILWMYKRGYRIIDERKAWSAKSGTKSRGVLHFDKMKKGDKEGYPEPHWQFQIEQAKDDKKAHTHYDRDDKTAGKYIRDLKIEYETWFAKMEQNLKTVG